MTLESLREEFIARRIRPTGWLGDSPIRFDTYTRYAVDCQTICEFGVYTGLSTTAFMMGHPQKLTSYDIYPDNFLVRDILENYARDHNIDFQFKTDNSLKVQIEETDLLFLDTVHEREHVYQELKLHAPKTKKYIMIHDVAACEPVLDAVIDYIKYDKNWKIKEHCNRGSGLMVLEKNRVNEVQPLHDDFFGETDRWNF